MKNRNGFLFFLLLVLILLNTSCRKEESVFEGTTPEDRLLAGSNVSNLLIRTTMNDGSKDNILDNASCFSVKLPANVLVNGTSLELTTVEDYDLIRDLFDENNNDDDVVEIVYPATLIFSDFTEEVVSNTTEFEAYVASCGGENQDDEDIECVDIVYPVSISLFNTLTESIESATVANDRGFSNLLSNLNSNDVVTINFPVSLILSDGSVVETQNIAQLENTIDASKDDCDEADNNNFEPDCVDCDEEVLFQVWTSCADWSTDKLILGLLNVRALYFDLSFDFRADGTVIAKTNPNILVPITHSGTWSVAGSGNTMTMDINIPSLPDYNGTWNVYEIRDLNDSKRTVELRKLEDSLRFKEACN